MRYFVTVDAGGGRRLWLAARVDERGRVQVYSLAAQEWVDAPPDIGVDVTAGRGWAPLPEDEVASVVAQLRVEPGHWLTVTRSDEEPQLLVRTADGRSLEGYAVSSARWEPMSSEPTAVLNDPALWQPVADEDVAQVQGWLHLLWDVRQQKEFDARAPQLVVSELTELAVRRGVVHYIVEILKRLPDGLVVGFKNPAASDFIGGWGSGPLGPGGSWNFDVRYWLWGFPPGANDGVFDAFKRLFDAWGWTYRYDPTPGNRRVDARTSKERKYSYHVAVSRYPHGGVSMKWTSPYYPAEYADPDLAMPSVITKSGIQSWDRVHIEDRPWVTVRESKRWSM